MISPICSPRVGTPGTPGVFAKHAPRSSATWSGIIRASSARDPRIPLRRGIIATPSRVFERAPIWRMRVILRWRKRRGNEAAAQFEINDNPERERGSTVKDWHWIGRIGSFRYYFRYSEHNSANAVINGSDYTFRLDSAERVSFRSYRYLYLVSRLADKCLSHVYRLRATWSVFVSFGKRMFGKEQRAYFFLATASNLLHIAICTDKSL